MSVDHPAIPGHFRGNAIVPGALLLATVVEAPPSVIGKWSLVTRVVRCQLRAPLLPGARSTIERASRVPRHTDIRVLARDLNLAEGALRDLPGDTEAQPRLQPPVESGREGE